MKALRLSKYDVLNDLKIVDMPKPEPKEDEVLVNIYASSINDWDWSLVTGRPFYIRLFCGLLTPKINIPGTDISGIVIAVGKNVTKFKEGDHVLGDLSNEGFGGFAEYVCVKESSLSIKPHAISFLEAAALPHAGALAYQALLGLAKIGVESKILINGAGGGFGMIAVQLAKHLGCSQITGVDRKDKHQLMRELGYTNTIDYQLQNFTKTGEKYDFIFDAKSNQSIFNYRKVLKPHGRYITVGGDMSRLLEIFVLGGLVNVLGNKKYMVLSLKPNEDIDIISNLCEDKKVVLKINNIFSLHEVVKAIKLFGSGLHLGKIIVDHQNKT